MKRTSSFPAGVVYRDPAAASPNPVSGKPDLLVLAAILGISVIGLVASHARPQRQTGFSGIKVVTSAAPAHPMTVEQTSSAAVTPHLKLFGVINTSAGGRAFIGFTGDDQHVYEDGDRISAGSFLAEVRPDRVRISHAGWSEWLSLAGNPDAASLRPRDPESLRRESESRNAGALPYSQGVRHGRLRAGSPSVISSHEAT